MLCDLPNGAASRRLAIVWAVQTPDGDARLLAKAEVLRGLRGDVDHRNDL